MGVLCSYRRSVGILRRAYQSAMVASTGCWSYFQTAQDALLDMGETRGKRRSWGSYRQGHEGYLWESLVFDWRRVNGVG